LNGIEIVGFLTASQLDPAETTGGGIMEVIMPTVGGFASTLNCHEKVDGKEPVHPDHVFRG